MRSFEGAGYLGGCSTRVAGLLVVLAFTGCGDSSDAGGETADASMDHTAADSTTADVSLAVDSTTVDAVHEASGDEGDSSLEGSVGASSDAPTDARDGEAGSHADGATGDGEAAATCQPVDASTPDPSAVAAGMALVNSHVCTLCHTTALSGGVVVPPGATSKNLTPDPATGLGCWTDDQIVTVILDGVTPEGDTLCVMPKWRTKPLPGYTTLTPDSARQIVQYLRTIAPVHNVVPPTDCVALGLGPPPDAGSDAAARDASDGAVE
jgi:hypothetical protein